MNPLYAAVGFSLCLLPKCGLISEAVTTRNRRIITLPDQPEMSVFNRVKVLAEFALAIGDKRHRYQPEIQTGGRSKPIADVSINDRQPANSFIDNSRSGFQNRP